VSPLSTDYDGLIGSMSLAGAGFVSTDGRYSLSQQNRMEGGIQVTGTVTGTSAATKQLVGRYTNPEDRRNTLPISMNYVPASYERPSSLTTVRGSYQSAGTYFGNSWWLRIESTTDTNVNRLVGSFNDGCAISGELTAPDPARGLYQVTYLRLSGTKCARDDEDFFGAAALTFNNSGNKAGLWLMARHHDLNSGIKPVIMVGDISAGAVEPPELISFESEGLWVSTSGFKGVILPNGQYFFYGVDGSILYGLFSSSNAEENTLLSTNGVYRAQGGVPESGLTVVASSTKTGEMTITFTRGTAGTPQVLTFTTEAIGLADSPPLYRPTVVPPLAALVGSYQTSGGFGGNTGSTLVVSGDQASSNLIFQSVVTPTCSMNGSISPYGTLDTNLYAVSLIYSGEGCSALQVQQRQGGVAVVTLNAGGGVSGIRLLAYGESQFTGERLHTVYEGAR